MPRALDITGERYGRLVAISKVSAGKWLCQCDCGNYKIATTSGLRTGNTKSCGCLHSEMLAKRNHESRKHGCANDRLYGIWRGMKQRCYDKNRKDFKNYGGRGIKVCEEWSNSFESFREWALENGYRYDAQFMKCTLDRIDNNGNYEPANCRWVTIKEQMKSRRNNRVRDSRGRFEKAN